MTRKRKTVGMKAIDAVEEIPREEREKLFTQGRLLFDSGLRLQLETVLRKNPFFKGSRRGSEHMKLSREEKRMALRFIRCFVKAYFIVQARDERAFRQN